MGHHVVFICRLTNQTRAGIPDRVDGNRSDARENIEFTMSFVTAPKAVITIHLLIDELGMIRRNSRWIRNEAGKMTAADNHHGICRRRW